MLEELHGDLVNEGVLSQSNRSFLINLPMVMIVFEEPTNGNLASRRTLSNATNVTSFVTYQRNQMLEELADILPYSDQASKDLVRMSRLL